jgi:uncharacterized protein
MSFERFGRVSFTSQTKVGDFVDYLEKGELCATRCRACGRLFFPPRADCASCLSGEIEWAKVEGQGKLVSFTRACYAPTGFEEDVPYVLAVAEFNDGLKVFGRFTAGVSFDQLKTGAAVRVSAVSLPDGQTSYEFLPVLGRE